MEKFYGVYNSVAKCYQFGICETSKKKATKKLIEKIGKDSLKHRFKIQGIPESQVNEGGKLNDTARMPRQRRM